MLEIHEGRIPDRKLVLKMHGETLDIRAVHPYLIWLELAAEGKVLLTLYVSPHQLGRLGKYLSDGQWRDGAVCPGKTIPEGCDIIELNDQVKYSKVLDDIKRHKEAMQAYEGQGWAGNIDWHRKQVSDLELEAMMLKDSTRFGLTFQFVMAAPYIEIEWLPEDTESEARKFLEATRAAYDMRIPEPVQKADMSDWKWRLFDI